MCAFFAKHISNTRIYEWHELNPKIYLHCMIVGTNSLASFQPHLKPYTKIVYISCEPEGFKGATFAHLVIDCKRFSSLLHPEKPFLYLPFYAMSFTERLAHPSELLTKKPLTTKSKFCAYMYSNPVPFRDSFYDALCKYKPVDALGSCRSNKPRNKTTRILYDPLIVTYYEDAIKQYEKYKFVIAIENSQLNGYITEKLVNPFLANSVPIYLGAPDVLSEYFNPKAMIHVRDFKTYDDCVGFIKQVDQDKDLYEAYLNEPLFLNNELPPYFDSEYILPTFARVFGQDT
jgi:hypothetical protein